MLSFREMFTAFVVFLVFAAVITLGSWQLSRKWVPEPDEATATALQAAAERWWRPNDTTNRDIPEAEWPVELRRLQPERVWVNSAGVFMKFGSGFVEEWGLFVLHKGSDFRPEVSR